MEAYLSRKWFNRISEDYEPAAAKSVTVDSGATLEVYGGASLAVESLAGSGTLSGSVDVADGGEMEVVVSPDGSVSSLDVTGGMNLIGGGTVRVSGSVGKIAAGSYEIAKIASGNISGWRVELPGISGQGKLQGLQDGHT